VANLADPSPLGIAHLLAALLAGGDYPLHEREDEAPCSRTARRPGRPAFEQSAGFAQDLEATLLELSNESWRLPAALGLA